MQLSFFPLLYSIERHTCTSIELQTPTSYFFKKKEKKKA